MIGDVTGNIEPAARETATEYARTHRVSIDDGIVIQLSIAISLKRIADALAPDAVDVKPFSLRSTIHDGVSLGIRNGFQSILPSLRGALR